MTLVSVDTSSEVNVITLLESARTWLAQAVEASPMEVAFVKAQIATAAEATKQLNLSKEIQLDAVEMVRRAEYALGKAIRQGQADGTIAKRGDLGGGSGLANGGTRTSSSGDLVRPSDFFKNGDEWTETYRLADVAPEVFEEALADAKAEGNPSRANVLRKVKVPGRPETRDDRADLIVRLATEGYSIRQMPAKVGVAEDAIRRIIRDYDIDVPAERSVSRTKRHDSTRIASQTVTALEGLVMGVELIDYDDLDQSQASQWADSLNHSMTALKRFHQQIRKATQ